MPRKWWGWGDAEKSDDIEAHPELYDFIKKRISLPDGAFYPVVKESEIRLPSGHLSEGFLRELGEATSPDRVLTDTMTRLTRSAGMGYKDLLRLRKGLLPDYVDAVACPVDEGEVTRILALCQKTGTQVIPYGGGSSVVGGLEVIRRHGEGVLSVDLRLMSRLLSLDATSMTATFETGVFGPDLEKQLSMKGFTLGHFPQSFEYSTLGGWIATRGAGSSSNVYGKIEDMVLALRVATPSGTLVTKAVPKSAAGPDLRHVFLGSEGTLGVITQATLAVRRVPATRRSFSFLFKTFGDGLSCVQSLVQGGLRNTTLRLSDPEETDSFYHSRGETVAVSAKLKETVGMWMISRKGLSFQNGSLLIAISEGDPAQVEADSRRLRSACDSGGGFALGSSPADAWMASRFSQPYMRDSLIGHGVLVETLETATIWSNVPKLHDAVSEGISRESTRRGKEALVMCHLSHTYPTGSSLYFTFMVAQEPGKELEQWVALKEAASAAIMAHGGTISHHHGVGLDHARWMLEEDGREGLSALAAIKKALDPNDIMNPCKLLPEGEADRR